MKKINKNCRTFGQAPTVLITIDRGVPSNPDTIVARIRAMRSALSVTKLADLLGMGRNTVYVLVRSGKIPSMRIAGTVRLDPAAIADWLEERSMAA